MPEEKVLKGQDAFDLYKQGKDAWNAWAEQHEGWEVDFSDWDFVEEGSVDFDSFHFPGPVFFIEANFGEGGVSFNDAQFGEGTVNFRGANFGKGDVSFSEAQFGEGNVFFLEAQFGDGYVCFIKAQVGEGDVSFNDVQFGEGTVTFRGAKFGKGDVFFHGTKFGEGEVSFNDAQFGEGYVTFGDTQFGEGNVFFMEAHFGKGDVSFRKASFGTGGVFFCEANFGKGDVSFSEVNFGKGAANFEDTQFGEGNVSFGEAQFGEGKIYFSSCRCKGPTSFGGAEMGKGGGPVVFEAAVFESSISLDNVTFNCVPDFRHAKVERDISMEDTRVHYQRERHLQFLWKALSPDDASKYRKLKKLATEAKDHDRELEFFSYELRAKYVHRLNWLQYLPIFLYGLFSDFGRSVVRPIAGLLILWIFTAQLLYWRSFEHLNGTYWNALWLSAGNLLPFASWSRVAREKHINALYGGTNNADWIVDATAYGESVLALVFIFLLGLALRNKLRV